MVQCDFTYTGALSVDLDVSLPLGVPATVSVKLQGIKGQGYLTLAAGRPGAENVIERDGHWWFAFSENPVIDLRTETTLRVFRQKTRIWCALPGWSMYSEHQKLRLAPTPVWFLDDTEGEGPFVRSSGVWVW